MFSEPVELWKLAASSATLLMGLIGILFVSRSEDGKLTVWGKALVGLLLVSFCAAVGTQWRSFSDNRESARKSRQTIEELRAELEAAQLQRDRLLTQFNPYELRLGFLGTVQTDLPVFSGLWEKWLELVLENHKNARQLVHGDSGDFYLGGESLTVARGDEGYPVPSEHAAAAVLLDRLNIRLKIFKTPVPVDTLKNPSQFASKQADFEAYFPGPAHTADGPGSRAIRLSLTDDHKALSGTMDVLASDIGVQPFGGNRINSLRDLLGAQLVVRLYGYVPASEPDDVREAIEASWNRVRFRQLELFTGARRLVLTKGNGLESVADDNGNVWHVFHLTDVIRDFLPEL